MKALKIAETTHFEGWDCFCRKSGLVSQREEDKTGRYFGMGAKRVVTLHCQKEQTTS